MEPSSTGTLLARLGLALAVGLLVGLERGVSVAAVGHAVLAALLANALGKLALAMSAGPVAFWLPLAASTLAAAGAASAVLAAMG